MFKALRHRRSAARLEGKDELLERSARNIDRAKLTDVAQLNAWDIMQNRTLLGPAPGSTGSFPGYEGAGDEADAAKSHPAKGERKRLREYSDEPRHRHGQHERHHQAAGYEKSTHQQAPQRYASR